MMTLGQIQRALVTRNLSAVARQSGASYTTIRKMADGTATGERVSYKSVRLVSDYLESEAMEVTQR